MTDTNAAKAFYTSASGWSLTDYGPEYAGIQDDGSEQGGLRVDSAVQRGGRRFHFCDPAGNELAAWSDRSTADSELGGAGT